MVVETYKPLEARIVNSFVLFLPGPTLTRYEPLRAKTGRMYPHPKTIAGLAAWRAAWVQSGRLHVEGPVIMEVYVRCKRPESHTKTSGTLNANGRRYPVPTGFDLSNVVKLVEDALKHMAFADDSMIAALYVRKSWTRPGKPQGTEVTISGLHASL